MEYRYENFNFPPNQSFTIRTEPIELIKYTHMKCHLNFEIALIENCEGKRFIGDHIADFRESDLVLMGGYLPHCWQYYGGENSYQEPRVTVVHFFPDFLGKDLLDKPEARHLKELFHNASKGIRFTGSTLATAKGLLQEMLVTKGLHRASLMLHLLDVLAQSSEYSILATPGFNIVDNSADADKINLIYDYIFKNFKETISLSHVAGLVNMNPAAFCRFFKAKTNRTLLDFIKEVRIGFAAKLLIEGTCNVSEACYSSGHNNLSNFNKHFKEIKGQSPRSFVKEYAE